MEHDLGDKDRNYDDIRQTGRFAEVLKALFFEVEETRHQAEWVMLVARHRIGNELLPALHPASTSF
jgi:hypothetical protein